MTGAEVALSAVAASWAGLVLLTRAALSHVREMDARDRRRPGAYQTDCRDPRSTSTMREQTRLALAMVRASRKDCSSLPEEDRLAEFASGSCSRGRKEARHRFRRAHTWLETHPFVAGKEPAS